MADQTFIARRIAKAREALGDDAFAAGEVSGRALSHERALDDVAKWLAGAG